MGGSFDYNPGVTSRAGLKTIAGAFRYRNGKYAYLPNVVPERVQRRFGAHPSVANLRYAADGYGNSGYPVRFEDALPLTSNNPYVLNADDRIVIAVLDPFGRARVIFDGFAKVPQANLGVGVESVSFQAIGVEERCWDTPLPGAYYRDGSNPASGGDHLTGIPARFNDATRKGVSPSATDEGDDGQPIQGFTCPSFLDPLICDSRGIGRKWSLAMAAQYVIAIGAADMASDPPWILLPYPDQVAALLDAWVPRDGRTIVPGDSSTYVSKPIIIREQVVTGKYWPQALHDLLEPHGFGMRFDLESDQSGNPITRLVLWKRNSGDYQRYKDVYLQAAGEDLDMGATNAIGMTVSRDHSKVRNQVTVETDLKDYEATFILAPGFPIASADVANKKDFIKTSPNYKNNVQAYRTWVFDETGDGHWDLSGASAVSGTPTDLSGLLGVDTLGAVGPKDFVVRRRPGRNTLISKDPDGVPRKAILEVSTDYTGPSPAVWDGDPTTPPEWRPVKGEWSLLKDRLGITLDCLNPNAVEVGSYAATTAGKGATKNLRLVEWLAGTPQQTVYFRLTTVIEGDQRGVATAWRRPASPTPYTLAQTVDAKDRYKFEAISQYSLYAGGMEGVGRDDQPDAADNAYARQAASELPVLGGTVRIPKISLAYRVGDRLRRIVGRNADLRTNAGTSDYDPPTYPEVIGVDHDLVGNQGTTLTTSDERADHVR